MSLSSISLEGGIFSWVYSTVFTEANLSKLFGMLLTWIIFIVKRFITKKISEEREGVIRDALTVMCVESDADRAFYLKRHKYRRKWCVSMTHESYPPGIAPSKKDTQNIIIEDYVKYVCDCESSGELVLNVDGVSDSSIKGIMNSRGTHSIILVPYWHKSKLDIVSGYIGVSYIRENIAPVRSQIDMVRDMALRIGNTINK